MHDDLDQTSRTPQAQAEVDQQCRSLALYEFESCPFCRRVLHEIERLSLNIELRNTREDPAARQELIEGGGRAMVPCLRITQETGETHWMYESADITAWLRQQFG
ncbi:glutaredoxin family protein [Kushneria sp. TE3]|uniref:glutaredoxin family protein n=1 Tax=Kushneria sp. TE3 TaxID=3449832 RepID=UPI003F6824CA